MHATLTAFYKGRVGEEFYDMGQEIPTLRRNAQVYITEVCCLSCSNCISTFDDREFFDQCRGV